MPNKSKALVGVIESHDTPLTGWMLDEVTPGSVRMSFDPLRGPFKSAQLHTSVVLTRKMIESVLARMDEAARKRKALGNLD